MFLKSLFQSINTVWCFIFIIKHNNGNIILFFHFCIVFFINRKFYNFKIKLFYQLRFLFTVFTYLTKYHLKHSYSSFWILINLFIWFLSSLGNEKQEFPSQGRGSCIGFAFYDWVQNLECDQRLWRIYVYD